MFLGYLSFSGTEIWNAARTSVYANELVPGLTVLDCSDCEDLHEVLGDKPYGTPFVDQAPWFDPNDPHTWDFAGVVPLSAEGVEDSTVEATTTDLVGGGGYVQSPVAKAREMRFTGLLVGADEAAVEAGMSWLKAALETNPCSATPGCTGDHLCYLSSCPQICDDSPGPAPARTNLAPNPRGRGNPSQSFTGGGSDTWPAGYVPAGESGAFGFVRENLIIDPAGTSIDPVWQFQGDNRSVMTNLNPNPSLETDQWLWGGPATSVVARDDAWSDPADGGDWSLRVAPAGTSVDTFVGLSSAVYGQLAAGKTYTITGTCHLAAPHFSDGGFSGRARRIWASWLGGTLLSEPAPNLAGDHVVSLTFTPPAAMNAIRLYNGAAQQVRTNLASYPTSSMPAAQYGQTFGIVDNTWFGPSPNSGTRQTITGATDGPALGVTSYQRKTWTTVAAPVNGVGMRFTGAGNTADGAVPITPGVPLYLGYYWRPSWDATVTRNRITVAWYDDAGTLLSSDFGPQDVGVKPAGQWTRVGAIFTPPAGATKVYASHDYYFDANVPPVGGYVDFSGLLAEQVAGMSLTPLYFDGNTPGSDLVTYAWTGAVGASTSVRTVLNPVWWDNLTIVEGDQAMQFNGDTPDTALWDYGWTGTPHASTSTATPIDTSVVTPVTGGLGPVVAEGRMLDTYVRAIAGESALASWSAPIVRDNLFVGQVVTASVWVYRQGGGEVQVSVTEGDTFTATNTVAGGNWTRVSVTHEVEQAAPMRLVVEFPDVAAGTELSVSGALVELGSELGDYFDGASRHSSTVVYEWSGAANASTSYEQLVIADSPTGVGYQWATATAAGTGDVAAAATGPTALIPGIRAAQTYGARADIYLPPNQPSGLGVGLRGSWRGPGGMRLPGVDDFWFDVDETPPVGWSEYRGRSAPAPVDAAQLVVSPVWFGAPVERGTTLAWAALLVEEGDENVPGTYFDGDFSDTPQVIYDWSGVRDASASTVVPVLPKLCPSGEPATDTEACMFDYLRHMRVVSTTSGPTITQKYSPSCGALWQVEWTMVAGVPHAYTSNYFIGSTTCPTDQCVVVNEVECVEASVTVITDPDCPPLPAPPRPPDIPIDCLEFPDQWCRFAIPIPKDVVPTWSAGVPFIQLRTGGEAVRQLRLRFYSNPFNRDLDLLDGCDYCGEFFISYIPPNAIMSIDGVEEQVTVELTGGRIATGNHLLYGSDGGPMSWPELICGIPFTAVVDVAPASNSEILVTLCVAFRS